MPWTFIKYIGLQFVKKFIIITLVIAFIVFLIDYLECLRRLEGTEAGALKVLIISILSNLSRLEHVLGIVLFLASLLTILNGTRNLEIVSAKTQGVTPMQINFAPVVGAFIFGIIYILVINPISAKCYEAALRLELNYKKHNTSFIQISNIGLWLKEEEEDLLKIIHAQKIDTNNSYLEDITIYYIDNDFNFIKRLDAAKAVLFNKNWEIENAIVTTVNNQITHFPYIQLPTKISFHQIENSMMETDAISFFKLPSYIAIAEESGFNVSKYRMQFYKLLLSPIFFACMAFLGSAFTKILPRSNQYYKMVVTGVIVGFLVYFIGDFISAYSLNGAIPIIVGALLPSIIAISIAFFAHAHYEYT